MSFFKKLFCCFSSSGSTDEDEERQSQKQNENKKATQLEEQKPEKSAKKTSKQASGGNEKKAKASDGNAAKKEGEPEHFHDNDELAEEANKYRDRARKYRDDAHKPENKANKDELYKKADAEDAKASKLIFDTLNKKQPEGTIDLHLQFVKEAVKICEEQYEILKGKNYSTVTFIVGKGNHSEGGVCKLQPAVVEWAKNKGLKTELAEGKVIVSSD